MPTTKTTTRLELRTQDGDRITAECDLIPGHAGLNEHQNITRNNGRYELEWDDASTDMYWDASEPERRYGEALYQCERGAFHLAGELVIAEITTDDGNEKVISTTPYTNGIEAPRTIPVTTPEDRAATAIKYTNWITGSAHDAILGLLTTTARDRIQARAREYAQAAGIKETLDAILAALETA